MSDFGFDSYALDDLGSSGTSHPLQVARDLIETGKPRTALDVLAEHHARLADDADYLMLCGQAWFAAGDAPRAQHALLGAARVAPDDPRPLQLLGDLLLERGETERANRLFRKAARLREPDPGEVETFEEAERGEGDLIAFAERKERRRKSPVAVRQWVLMLLTVGGLGALMSTIASWVAPSEPIVQTRPAPDAATAVATEESEAAEPPAETTPPPPPAETTPPPEREVTRKIPRESTVPAPGSKPTVPAPPPDPEPEAAVLVGTRWPEPEATLMLAPPAPIADSSVPTIPFVAPALPARQKVVKKKARPNSRRSTKKAPPVVTQPVITEAAIEAELTQVSSARGATDRGDQLAAQGQLAVAARFYRRSLDLDPDYAPALVAMGRSLLRAEKYGDAMRSATRALQLARGIDARPGLEAEALYQMGRVRHEWGDRDAARRLLRQSISMPGTPAEAWFYLGESLAMDNWPDARAAYEEYLERRPNGHLSDRARRAIQ